MTNTKSGSLFSGTGALDLAAEEVFGAVPAWFCEYEDAPSRILAHHWPDVRNYGDVTAIDWNAVAPVDLITAGYPCQPFSLAGSRKGQDDVRHLWPYVAEAIRHLRPRYVLLENVRGHLSLGFGDVLGDLAVLGYDAQWSVVRASAAGAPHRRERVFILATDTRRRGGDESLEPSERRAEDRSDLAYERGAHDRTEWGRYEPAVRRWESITGRRAPRPVVPTGRDGRDRLNPELPEWMMGLDQGHITDVPGLEWKDQLKAAGNGVVRHQAVMAFRHLLKVAAL
jgi:DNA (cytosine-5)-methyltransferase 1